MAYAVYDKKRYKKDDGSIKAPDKGGEPYFHINDLEEVKKQSGVICYSIRLCEVKYKGDVKRCYAMFGAKKLGSSGAEEELMDDGDIFALSCPNFADKEAGKKVELDLHS